MVLLVSTCCELVSDDVFRTKVGFQLSFKLRWPSARLSERRGMNIMISDRRPYRDIEHDPHSARFMSLRAHDCVLRGI